MARSGWKTVSAASGTGHNIGTATSLQRGLSVNNFFLGGGDSGAFVPPADAGVPRKYRILKFVEVSFGPYSVLLADDRILDPSYDVWE